MIVYVHAGLDKSGSTAIQRSLGLNQSWLNDQGYCFPKTGRLFGGSHEGLFNADDKERWEELRKELDEANSAGKKAAVVSFEGIHFIKISRLIEFKKTLNKFDVVLILYLRDQAEIIQSGYFQQIKQQRINLSVESFKEVKTQFLPDSRNYEKKLEKLKKVFGANSLDVRLYDRELFAEHDIVMDFYGALSLKVDDLFQFPPHDINPSLDLPAVILLNLIDRFFNDTQGRREFVNQLVLDAEKNGSQGKYFLDKPAVEEIRAYYRKSNMKVLAKYFSGSLETELFPRASSACRGMTFDKAYSFAAEKIARTADKKRATVWNGEELSGTSLGLVCRQENGWSWAGDEGAWIEGKTSRLSFVIPSIKLFRENGRLLISTIGKYYTSIISSQILSNGRVIHSGDIENGNVELLLADISEGYVDIEIIHQETTSRLSSNKRENERKPKYLLKSISYSLKF